MAEGAVSLDTVSGGAAAGRPGVAAVGGAVGVGGAAAAQAVIAAMVSARVRMGVMRVRSFRVGILAVSCVWGWGLVQFFEFLDNPLVAGAVGVVAADVLPLDLAVLVDDEGCGGGASGAVAVEYAVLLDYLAVGVV